MKNSLKKMIAETTADDSVINYQLRKHKYLVLINDEWRTKVLLESSNCKSIKIENGLAYLITFNTIFIKGLNKSVNQFEIDLDDENSDIEGYDSLNAVHLEYGSYELNFSEELKYKLIFSPQVARWLLQNGYRIVDIKQRKNSKDAIFVFEVEDGFFNCINKYKEIRNNDKI